MLFHSDSSNTWRSACGAYRIYAGIRDFSLYRYNCRGMSLVGKTQSLAEAQKLCEKDLV